MFEPKTQAEQLMWATLNRIANAQRPDTVQLDDLGALDAIDTTFEDQRQLARRTIERIESDPKPEWPEGAQKIVVFDIHGNKYTCRHILSPLELQLTNQVHYELQSLCDMFGRVLGMIEKERRKQSNGQA